MRLRVSALIFFALLLAAPTVHAGYGCPRYDAELESSSVSALAVQGGKVVFQRGLDGLTESDREDQACQGELSKVVLTQEEFLALRPEYRKEIHERENATEFVQTPTSCKQAGSDFYFGLSFYGGEGATGVGGIGRFNTETKKLEVRRPKALRPLSVYELLAVDNALWLITAFFGEGGGYGGSLARYDWETARFETFEGANGPCGFDIKDVLVHERELWVATELGISRYALDRGTWKHFRPVDRTSQALRETSCLAIYQDLAQRLSNEADPSDAACDRSGDTPHGNLRALLEHYRPEDARAIPWKKSPPASPPDAD